VAHAAGNTLDIVLDGGLGKALELEMIDKLTADCGHGDLLFVGLMGYTKRMSADTERGMRPMAVG